jgi:nucleoside 2-deoxyribosyltransferase
MERKLKVYVAGPSIALPLTRMVQVLLEKSGLEITHDWTERVQLDRDGVNEEDLDVSTEFDLMGVKNADIVVLVVCRRVESPGSWYEAGYAGALGKAVVALVVDGYTTKENTGNSSEQVSCVLTTSENQRSSAMRRLVFLNQMQVTWNTSEMVERVLYLSLTNL